MNATLTLGGDRMFGSHRCRRRLRTTPSSRLDGADDASANGPQFVLTLHGADFHGDTIVLWEGQLVFSKTLGEYTITATVPSEKFATAGTVQV